MAVLVDEQAASLANRISSTRPMKMPWVPKCVSGPQSGHPKALSTVIYLIWSISGANRPSLAATHEREAEQCSQRRLRMHGKFGDAWCSRGCEQHSRRMKSRCNWKRSNAVVQ